MLPRLSFRVVATASRSPLASASIVAARRSAGHVAESFDEFNARYEEFFRSAPDLFEVNRGMTNMFAHDLVPTVEVIEEVMRAARKFHHFPTAVRVLEGVKAKVEKPSQYEAYLAELKPLMEELGVLPVEEMYGVQHANRVYHGEGEGQEVK